MGTTLTCMCVVIFVTKRGYHYHELFK